MGLYSCTGPKEWIGVVVDCNAGGGGSLRVQYLLRSADQLLCKVLAFGRIQTTNFCTTFIYTPKTGEVSQLKKYRLVTVL